jgi:glycosyltransferase involved in cell wall biosynthesis
MLPPFPEDGFLRPNAGGNLPPRSRRRILYVAYSLATVSDESCGGAEQMLWALEREIAGRGHATTVAACSHSVVCGELLDTGSPAVQFEQLAQRDGEHRAHVVRWLRQSRDRGCSPDLIHDEGGRFWSQAAVLDVPLLATLHLPRSFYPAGIFDAAPPNVHFNCVSFTQAATFSDLPRLLGVVRNGVPLERFPFTSGKDSYLVWLGRICEEKGLHIALQVAERAGMPLVILGPSYRYWRDQEYFDREVAPRMTSSTCFIGSPSFDEKIEILRHARALLMPSLLPETSSLVCIEAMACGTPAIAFRHGALPEVVLDGSTGFVVDSLEQMVEAVARIPAIRASDCRAHVELHHSAAAMATQYERLYDALASSSASLAAVPRSAPASRSSNPLA